MRIKNGLVMIVILMFIGVAVQPSIAVNPISSDNEEDCIICPKVSNLQWVEKHQRLFDKITTFTEINKEVKPDYPYPIICNILLLYINFQLVKWELYIILPGTVQILFIPLFVKNAYFIIGALSLYFGEFDCDEFVMPYW